MISIIERWAASRPEIELLMLCPRSLNVVPFSACLLSLPDVIHAPDSQSLEPVDKLVFLVVGVQAVASRLLVLQSAPRYVTSVIWRRWRRLGRRRMRLSNGFGICTPLSTTEALRV